MTPLSPNCLESRGKWQDAREGEDGVTPRKRTRVDLFSTQGMRWKPGGTPEAEEPAGMAESSEGLAVARAEVKALQESVGKVSVGCAPISDPWNLGGCQSKLKAGLCLCGPSKCPPGTLK